MRVIARDLSKRGVHGNVILMAMTSHFQDDQRVPLKEVGSDPFYLLSPKHPALGSIAAFARQSKFEEIKEHERDRVTRTWRVRGIISDHVPLTGDPSDAIQRVQSHLFFVNENPLSMYLHSGGRNAVYYDLVGDDMDKLKYIEV